MKKTLYLKFVLAYVIFGFFSFIVVATFSSSLINERVKSENAESLYAEASMVSKTYAAELDNNEITFESAYHQLHALGTYLSSTIWLVNPSGTVLVNSDKQPDVANPQIIDNFTPSITADSYYTTGDFFGEYEQNMLIIFSPITSNYKIQGYVIIAKPVSLLNEQGNGYLTIMYITMVLLLLLSLIILLFFTEMFYIPLRKVIYATEQYASGNMHYEFTVESSDEMGYLAGTLNYMASEIARSEDNQKKFVANVSHDFRSPLTSIKGYLEAMLDGTIPPEMHEKYITIVLNETERLTKLTNSLLTLNNLNTKGMLLDKTDFDINQVIRNTASTFEGTCHNKSIAIEMIQTGNEMYVHADMGKIQQVLYNLMDNAIKFSNTNSVIEIHTVKKHHKVFVSVKDHGIGIPEEQLPYIFEKFYTSKLRQNQNGTGLGLMIAKQIAKRHDGDISVESTPGEGTTFSFVFTECSVEDAEAQSMLRNVADSNEKEPDF